MITDKTMQELTIRTHNMFVDMGPGLALELSCDVELGEAFSLDKVTTIPSPYPHKLKAVWDTGAMVTGITRKLALDLGLDKIGERLSHGVTGCEVCNHFLVSLYLPGNIVIPALEIGDCGGNIGCDILIGMDVIQLGDFACTNYMGNTTFTFRVPSVECINFTSQLPNTAITDKFIKNPKVCRNELCPCGSGKKYKKCCGK